MERALGADRPVPAHRFFAVLALASGATDAFGYLRLGGTFTSVMTGNMVLFAVAAAHADGALVVRTALAICGYLGGAALGVRLAGVTYTATPARTVRLLLWTELALFMVYAIVFQMVRNPAGLGAQGAMLMVAALGLGIQSSAVQSYQVSGLSTTFLTGTLTSVAVHLAQGRPLRHAARSLHILCGLLAGAGAAAGLALASPRAAAALPAVLVAVALTASRHSAGTADRTGEPEDGKVRTSRLPTRR